MLSRENDPDTDTLFYYFSTEPIAFSMPLSSRAVADFDVNGAVVSIEVFGATPEPNVAELLAAANRVGIAFAGRKREKGPAG